MHVVLPTFVYQQSSELTAFARCTLVRLGEIDCECAVSHHWGCARCRLNGASGVVRSHDDRTVSNSDNNEVSVAQSGAAVGWWQDFGKSGPDCPCKTTKVYHETVNKGSKEARGNTRGREKKSRRTT